MSDSAVNLSLAIAGFNENASRPDAKRQTGGNPTNDPTTPVEQNDKNNSPLQPSYFNPNDFLPTWNISLTDDQDEVSERFLMMRPTSDAAPEQFGPALMAVDENLRKQADEQFKPSGTNPNGMHNFVDPKESWILPSFNQQYVNSVPKNALSDLSHGPYPWNNTSTLNRNPLTAAFHRSSPLQQPSSSSSSSSSQHAFHEPAYGASPCNSIVSGGNNNSSIGSNSGKNNSGSSAGDGTPSRYYFWDACSSVQRPQPVSSRLSSSSSSSSSSSTAADRSPPRLYCWLDTDTNTAKKLVEHYCTFCYKNREPPEVYGGHLVRNSTCTTCPKLRALKCKHCSATGDNAHTIKYCPYLYSNYSC